jgi:SAM-dependent methyltransferase
VRTRFAHLSDAEVAAELDGLDATRDRVLEAARIAPADRVLDVGAGTGLLAVGAAERTGPDGDVLALDISADALQELRSSTDAPNLWYLVGEAEVLPLPDGDVDVIVARSVLIYVDDLDEVAAEFTRVLRAGGRISVFEPINRRGTYLHDVVDWSFLGELGERVLADDRDYVRNHDPISRLEPELFVAALEREGLTVQYDLDQVDEEWAITEQGVDRRLDAVGAPGQPTRRQRWQARYDEAEVDRLVDHLKSLAGTSVRLRWTHLWLTAQKDA